MTTTPPTPTTVKGRFRRPPAPWLWLALLLIPLILALLSWFLRDDDQAQTAPAPAATSPTSPTTSAATQTDQAGSPVEVTGAEGTLTVTATVPDEQTRQTLLESVQDAAGDRQVIDEVLITEGQPVTDFTGLPQVLTTATGQFEQFGVRVTDDVVTLRGTAPREEDLAAVEQSAQQAFPGREVQTELDAEAPVAGTTLSCENIEGQIEERLSANPINFPLESAQIEEDSRQRLLEIGEALADCNSTGITVIGHTDATGPDEINVPLSQERAEAVGDVLVEAGVDAGEVTAQGVADEGNVAPNDEPTARAENRRTEILVEGEGR